MSQRDDSQFKANLCTIAPRPIFIIGLHRSGTTFLYQMLAGFFRVASLTAYHVINYDQVLVQHHDGTAVAVQHMIDGLFQSWNMATRRIDDVELSHAMPEEYGWLLRRNAGAFHANSKTAPLLDEICRKLHLLTPSAEAVLLKNPRDTGHVSDLLTYFPDARFIFLERDPVAIMNSQLRVAKYHAEMRDPYLSMLLSGITFGRTAMSLQRTLRKVTGDWHGQIVLRYIMREVTRDLGRFEISWNIVPPRRRLALTYSGMVRDQAGVLKKVASSLGLSPRGDPVRMNPNPRDPTLLPEVAAAEAYLRRRLKKKRIAQRPLEEI